MRMVLLLGFIKRAAQFILSETLQRTILIVRRPGGNDLCLDDFLLLQGVVELLFELEDAGFF
jgi:hypothetical protein